MRTLAVIAHACVCAVVFVSALAAGALLYLLLVPTSRRLVTASVNETTAPLFAGHLTIDSIGRLGLTRIDRVDAHVDDADGTPVLRMEGVSGRVSTLALVRSLLSQQPIAVEITELSIERVDAHLDADDAGVPRIARAFMPRSPTPENARPGRGVRLALPHIHVGHALLRAQPSAPYDADLDETDASVTFSPLGLSVDLHRAHVVVRGLPSGGKAEGDVDAHFEKPSRGEQVARARWIGTAGAIRESANLALRGEQLDAVLDVAPAGPAEICALWPPWPIAAVCSAHAEAHGTLPRLTVLAHGSVGGGTVDVSGPVTLGPSIQTTTHIDLHGFDGHALVSPIPCSNVSASADVSLTAKPAGAVDGRVNVTLSDAECQRTHLPPATLEADLTRTAEGDTTGRGELAIREPGAPTLVAMQLVQTKGTPVLTFEGDARADRLQDVPRIGPVANGSAKVHVVGTFDFRRRALDARVSATARALRVLGAALNEASVEAHATGKLDAPSVDVEIDGEDVRSGSVHLSAFRTQGRLTFDGEPTVRDLRIDLAGEGAPVHARAALARISTAGARLDDVLVEGLGSPVSATLRASAAGVTVQAKGAAIDLERVGSFVPLPLHAGKMSLDLDAIVRPGAADGRVALDLRHGVGFGLRDVSMHVEGTVHGRRASWRATASAEDIGTFEGHSSSIEIGEGRLLTAAPWRHAWGAVDLDTRVDLSRLAAHLPTGALPLTDVRGQLEITAHVARDSPTDMTPEVEVTARTTGLALAGKHLASTWRIDGINPMVHAIVNGDTGATLINARVDDTVGALVTLEARSSGVPYAAIFSDERGVLDALRATPFDAHLELPSRSLHSLPPVLGMAGLRGDLQAQISLHGTPLDPTVDATAKLTRGDPDPRLVGLPFDLELGAHYDGAHLDTTLRGTRRNTQVLEATARVDSRAADWVAAPAGIAPAWTASVQAKLDRFPLRSLEQLDDRQVRGFVSGELSIDRWHDDARAAGTLTFEGLQIGDVGCKGSTLRATVDGHALDATAILDQADGGFIRLQAHSGARWGRAITPQIDATQLAQVSVSAGRFRAALLLPFVSTSFAELGGLIDGDARIEIDPTRQIARPSGAIALSDGTFELVSIGNEFHGVSAKLAMTPDGVIRLQDAVAHGITGKVSAYASAWLAGFSIGGASASVQIPSDDPLPIVFHGVPMGKLSGRFDVTANRTAREFDVVVDMPSAALELASGSATHDVQDLGDLAGVHIGVQRKSGEFIELALDAARDDVVDETSSPGMGSPAIPTKIEVRLGGDVQVTRGTDLDVRLEGQPTMTIGPGVHVTGQIRLIRGKINIQGKPFEIERGTVTFVGADASNPQVFLTAGWTAADGTRVFADFVGPLKTGKVTLRSEPARPQNEILALLLFGTTDQSNTNSTPQATSVAAAAGGVATQPLNQALGGVNRSLDKLGLAGGITTKVDTSTPNPRPEVEVQIARDISIQVAWVLGVIPPGTNPDTAYLTLNWRFLRNVSLETTVGDAGSSIVDMIWQHRY